ncbi:MAG: hypothetical protein GC164_11715 [Phycisphaera sp.]|nr:hypothetical protein [Phycisphaera sp.]
MTPTLKTISRLFVMTTLAAVSCSLMGCWGANLPPNDKPNTSVNAHVDFEIIPNAEVVRDSTEPEPRGRHGFRPGLDRVLVMTRVTTFTSEANKDNKNDTSRVKTNLERAWVTVPYTLKAGETLVVNDIPEAKLGYDVSLDGGAFFIYGNRITGTIKIVEEKEKSMVLDLDVLVTPQYLRSWRVQEQVEVPLTETGIHATPSTSVTD